ncbi:MAG: prenyltransferase/squalene oxidase repeat-containing protein [Gemmatales bacterium]
MLRRFVIPVLVATGILITPEAGLPVADDQTIKEMVQPAIAAGVEFLRQSQTAAGTWLYQGNTSPTNEQVVGASALCGIAMLENRVPANDKQIQAVAGVVRRAAADPNFNYNYSVCLSLLFLDRLNRERAVKDEKNFTYKHPDTALVLGLARKILGGQVQDGRWGYQLSANNGTNADNSNTQFAVVALWVARKYGKPGGPIDKALSLCEKRLRSSQDAAGAWNYETSTAGIIMRPTGSMTCAGILSLALHAGARVSLQATFTDRAGGTGDITRTLNEDPAIVKARAYLVHSLQNNTSPQGGMEGHVSYFLWSLERVATLFKWRKLDGVDWFDMGARYLMSKQNRNGSWSMDFLSGTYVDTAFALLFLGKSNLLGDLQEATFTRDKESMAGGPVIPQKKTEVKKTTDEQAKEILAKLLTASPDKQAEYVQELSDTKGPEYTDALVEAIKKIQTPTGKEMAREGLANRLQRFTPKVLNEYMSDNDRELRLAAVTAAKFKPDFRNAPANCSTIIPLLGDQDIGVSTAALETLKSISGQDFGKSVDRWSRWLEQSKTKKP